LGKINNGPLELSREGKRDTRSKNREKNLRKTSLGSSSSQADAKKKKVRIDKTEVLEGLGNFTGAISVDGGGG